MLETKTFTLILILIKNTLSWKKTFQLTPNYGALVNLGLNQNTMFGLLLMLVELQQKDIKVKAVNVKRKKI